MDEDVVAATWEDPMSLEPWADNPRHDQPIEQVARSIRELGFGAPIVAQLRTRRIIAGHTRWYAAQRLQLPKVPVRFVDVDDRQAELMALADNKVGEKAKWDYSKLGVIADRYELEDLGIAGFDDSDIQDIIKHVDVDITIDDDDDDDAGAPTDEPIGTSFAVVIECADEAHQVELIEMCAEKGWTCRALT